MKWRGHRDLGAVGQDEVGLAAELLDEAEDVVPAAAVEAGRVVAQLVEDLVHLEGGQDRLDQDGGADRAPRDAESTPGHGGRRRSTGAPRGGSPSSAGRSTARCPLASRACGVVEEVERRSRRAPPETGSPSTSTCFSTRCQPRGRTSSVAVVSLSAYSLPSGLVNAIVPRTASRRLIWPLDEVVPGGRVGVLEVGHEDASRRS